MVDSNLFPTFAPLEWVKGCCSSVVEHFLGKEEVTSSILVNSSKRGHLRWLLFCLYLVTELVTSHICHYRFKPYTASRHNSSSMRNS